MTTRPHCGCASKGSGPQHPVDDLSAEHRVIETLLDALGREARALAGGAALRREWLADVVMVLEEFADRCHHGKEEDLLFPELVRHGLSFEFGPVAVMKHEHVEGRALLRRLREAVERSDRDEVVHAIGAYSWLLRQHIQKEDHVLFPHARAMLPQTVVEGLRARFDAYERDAMGDGTHCKHLARARTLCADAPAGVTPA